MNIGEAVSLLVGGKAVRRAAWPEGQYVTLAVPEGYTELPYVVLHTVTVHTVPWTCSHEDLLGADWEEAPPV